eukprot:CAMPEP_0178942562 /NCGR_PEP_ID=MMETSP0789-20121207/2066_1 /TAXON_ID=3005 /ORGANISM="Rhizosolenia setigera, Strain CCMP 1694" /LENGTH=356 /DNA_ID=CAMNT_0020621991 /DNA_START=282 /DNA_END=1352 /DNA_ORIENTATION=+
MNFSTIALAVLSGLVTQNRSILVNAGRYSPDGGGYCGDDEKKLTLKLKTDGCWPFETYYKVWQNGEKIAVEEPGVFDKKSTEYKEEICFNPLYGCVVFEMHDTFGDGMTCGSDFAGEDGWYEVYVEDNKVGGNPTGEFGYSDVVALPCGPIVGPGPSEDTDTSTYTTSSDTWTTYDPFDGLCNDGEVGIIIEADLGSQPEQISWQLVTDSGDVVAEANYADTDDYLFTDTLDMDDGSGGNTTFNITWLYQEICYDPVCMTLTLTDDGGDGFLGDDGLYGYFVVYNEGYMVFSTFEDENLSGFEADFCADEEPSYDYGDDAFVDDEDGGGDAISEIFDLLEEFFRLLFIVIQNNIGG